QESIAPPLHEEGMDPESNEYEEKFLEAEEDVPLEESVDISAEVYNAIVPTTHAFHHTEARAYQQLPVQDSMIFSISSPLKRVGKMYELHRLALEEGAASSIFTL